MIELTLYVNKGGVYTGFKSEGHAGGEYSKDIVCASVSTAVFGVYYFIKYATTSNTSIKTNDGMLDVKLLSQSHDAQVAIKLLISQIEMVSSSPEGAGKVVIKIKGSNDT